MIKNLKRIRQEDKLFFSKIYQNPFRLFFADLFRHFQNNFPVWIKFDIFARAPTQFGIKLRQQFTVEKFELDFFILKFAFRDGNNLKFKV